MSDQSSRKGKGRPIPTRFEDYQSEQIEQLNKKTGLSESDIVRFSVRLLLEYVRKFGHLPLYYEKNLEPSNLVASPDSDQALIAPTRSQKEPRLKRKN